MKHSLLILISFLLLSSPVIGNNHKGETLYGWGEYPDYKWMGFGEKETHPKYQGQVKDGKPNGLGFLISPDGDKYVGGWKDGLISGQGTLSNSNGMKYDGEWKNGLPNGQGTETSPDGWRYLGVYKDGEKHGKGKLTYTDGGWYDGSWKEGQSWTGIIYNKDGNISYKKVNGKIQYKQ